MRHICVALLAAALAVSPQIISTASADNSAEAVPMQEIVDAVLASHGGEQIGWNEVRWNAEDVVLTIDPGSSSDEGPHARSQLSTAATRDDCLAGKYCVYSSAFYGGNKLTYSACPATNTAFGSIGAVRSIKNDRSSGSVRAYKGNALHVTLTAGKGSANVSGITKVSCS